MPDYAQLAKEFGGSAEMSSGEAGKKNPSAPPKDYSALAGQFGGQAAGNKGQQPQVTEQPQTEEGRNLYQRFQDWQKRTGRRLFGTDGQQGAVDQAIMSNPAGRAGAEAGAGIGRSLSGFFDSVVTEPVNEVIRQAGGEDQFFEGVENYLNRTIGMDQPFMKTEGLEGAARKYVVKPGSEIAPAAAGTGELLRRGAAMLPRTTAMNPATTTQGVVRQMGASTPAADLGYGGLSATGAEVGEESGLPGGRAVGSVVAPLTAGGIKGSLSRPQQALPEGAATTARGRQAITDAYQKRPQAAAQDATGIELFPAQSTLDPQKLKAQRFLPELSPTAQKASKALNRQNQQAARAVDDFVASIAPDDAIVRGPEGFRSAAQRAIQSAKDIRAEKASPFYQRAFKEGADVDLRPVRQSIARTLEDFPESGSVARSMRRVGKLIEGRPSLQKLHNAKLEIDDMLSRNTGDDALGNTAKRELTQLKQTLLDQIEDASGTYRDARLAFEAASPPVNKIQDSIIGKIADMDDTQLKRISRRIFDPAETNPAVVKQAKRVIDEVDPDAWNLLLRGEMERRMGSLKPELGASMENLPSKLKNAIFGTGKNRDALLAGMSPKQRQNAELLETALTRAGLGRPGGSETAGRQEFMQSMGKGGVIRTIKNWIRSPVDEFASVGDDTLFDRRAKALADVLFDPSWAPETTKALRDPSGKSLGFLLYQAADQIERTEKTRETQQQENQEAPPAQLAR